MEMAAATASLRPSTLKLSTYQGEAPLDAYLTQVRQVQGWLTEETAVRVALSLEDEALKILDDLLPHEQSD